MKKIEAYDMTIIGSRNKINYISFDVTICYFVNVNENKIISGKYCKVCIKSKEEFLNTLKIFVTTNLYRLLIKECCNFNIFDMLCDSFKSKSNIKLLFIYKLEDKDIKFFESFMKRLAKVKILEILKISTLKKVEKSLPSINLSTTTFESVNFSESKNTKFLNLKFIVELSKNNPRLRNFLFSSKNDHFLETTLIWFFFKQQLDNTKICNHNDISLSLYNTPNNKNKLINTLNSIVFRLPGIIEYQMYFTSKGNLKYKITKNCTICNTSLINMNVTLICNRKILSKF
ncbi:Hypothetical protein SRAE_1000058800 [Strongyloides ratti]|uniref:Uncharacterized protein n=1 Tax=Strongyloides ratti TaxID=34506 RepID=A0A090KXS6_STRRB|nr:Hypothetical protein SRAE_1000058800 [Strongyloides ratti]CEF62315.1 Hypothetical protein SRAE_1000058800 [Strongyloides ratti]